MIARAPSLLRRHASLAQRKGKSETDDSAAKSAHHSTFFVSYWLRTSRFSYAVVAILLCGMAIFYVASLTRLPEDSVLFNSNHPPNQPILRQQKKYDDKTVAFVVTITSCGGHKDTAVPFEIVEGAAVLRHSIHQNSKHGSGTYDYRLYALYHPSARACAATLTELGYIVQAQETPVALAEIQNELLRERIVNNGCCGEKELIKLAAFTLTQHALVVLLDIDVLLLKPLDRLFDFLLDPVTQRPGPEDLLFALPAAGPPQTQIDLLYTTDYAMVNAERPIKPTQGGFVVLRPNRTIYEDFVAIVREGDFRFEGGGDLGWGGRTGRFWGGTPHSRALSLYTLSLDRMREETML